MKKNKHKYKYVGLLYISPWIVGFLAFQLYPFIASFFYSFADYSMLTPPVFIGFKNYISMFTQDKTFYQSLGVTVLYTIITVPAKLAFALMVAMLLNVKIRGVNIFRTIFYIPSILGGSVSIAIVWRFLFMKEGLLNQMLSYLSIPPTNWLGNPDLTLYTISLLAVWQFGSSMVIFLAGLKQIPVSLYEAARIDGASRVKNFFTITIPMLSPVVLFNLVMQTIYTLQEFTSVFVITKGGPVKATYLYALMLYEQGFGYFRMGYASALSWIFFLIIMSMTVIIFKFFAKRTYYGEGG
jgi:oligogalacturonide transport system permease protein